MPENPDTQGTAPAEVVATSAKDKLQAHKINDFIPINNTIIEKITTERITQCTMYCHHTYQASNKM